MLRPGGREIIKKPISYLKPASQAERPVKKIPPRKPAAAKIEDSANKSTKETSTSKVVEVNREPPSVEPTSDGHYELSPMLGKMVEDELQGVMKKVWELPPTNPQDPAEKMILDRFRNKAGEALRNTLGLNITKRLLNVHNPLYVKMVFSGKPLRADLIAFLKRYSVSAFKRVGERGGTFAAKMRSFTDFDNLCTDTYLKCGKIHVTVTPCYQFMTCPPNLRTPYDSKKAGRNNDVASNNPLEAAVSLEINKQTEKNTEQQISQQNATKVTLTNTAVNATLSKVQGNQTDSAKITPKVTPAKVENKPAVKAAESTFKVTPAKPPVVSQTQDSVKKSQVQEKPSPAPKETTKQTNQTTAPKVASQNSSLTQKATPVKVTTPQNSTPKVLPAKPTQNSQNTPKATPPAQATQNCQNTAKTTPKVATPTKVTTQAQNSATKVLPATPTQNSQNITKTTPNVATPTKDTTQAQNSATKVLPATPPQNSQNIPKITPKVATPTKVTTQAQNSATKVLPAKPVNSQNTPKATPKQVAVPSKPAAPNNPKLAMKVATPKPTPAKIAGNKPKVATKAKISPKKKQSDFDELSDRDILALISEGIVLDECSGSDVD